MLRAGHTVGCTLPLFTRMVTRELPPPDSPTPPAPGTQGARELGGMRQEALLHNLKCHHNPASEPAAAAAITRRRSRGTHPDTLQTPAPAHTPAPASASTSGPNPPPPHSDPSPCPHSCPRLHLGPWPRPPRASAPRTCATIQRKRPSMPGSAMMPCIFSHSAASSRSMVSPGSSTPPAQQ